MKVLASRCLCARLRLILKLLVSVALFTAGVEGRWLITADGDSVRLAQGHLSSADDCMSEPGCRAARRSSPSSISCSRDLMNWSDPTCGLFYLKVNASVSLQDSIRMNVLLFPCCGNISRYLSISVMIFLCWSLLNQISTFICCH